MAIVGSNIEVYTCLNPLYYSIERKTEKVKGVDVLKKDYEIFKNLDENLFIDLRTRILKDCFNISNNNEYDEALIGKIKDESLINENTTTKEKKLNIEKLEQQFYSGNHFIKDYLKEEDTMFLYIDTFEGDPTLYYKDTQLKEIYNILKEKEKNDIKRACKIRVYSRSSDIKKETLKQTIDLDINNFVRELERYDSRIPGFKKITKVRIITDYDSNLDYLSLNVERIKSVNDKKKYIELVEYANTKLKEIFTKELTIRDDKDGRELGKTNFFLFPTLQKPGFIDNKKNVRDFLPIVSNDAIRSNIIKIKKQVEKTDIEFSKYIKELKEKLIKGEVIKQLDDFLKNFYELQLFPGINGSDIINITKDYHDKKYRFKKGSKGYISLNALDVELIVKMKQILPTGFYEFYILTREDIEIGTLSLTIDYGENKNTIKIEKVDIFDKSYYDEKLKNINESKKKKRKTKFIKELSGYKINELVEEYKKFFKIKDGKSELNSREGIITRKTRIVKNVVQIESYNLTSININKPFYIIPLISFDDKDVAEYLKKEKPDEYSIENDDLINILTNTQECYKFYLNVSTNNPSKVYDLVKYSESFKNIKLKQNVQFIISKILQKRKVFRPKIIQGEKPFRGIYKILGYELDENNRMRIIKNGIDNESKTGSVEEITGTYIIKDKGFDKEILLQLDPLTFVNFTPSSSSVLTSFPPRFQEISLKISEKKETETEILNRIYNVKKMSYEEFTKKDNIIRVPLKLYITQNPPTDHKDFLCEIRKNKIRRAFQKLSSSWKLYTKKPPLGKYISNEKMEKLKIDTKKKIEETKEEIEVQGGGGGGLFSLKSFF